MATRLEKEFVTPVELAYIQGTVILRARSSELLILKQHVKSLHSITQPVEFSKYFINQALVNRPARKLFEAWLRKDKTVWPRLFKLIQSQYNAEDFTDIEEIQPEKAASTTPVSKENSTSKEPETKKKTTPKSAKKSNAHNKPSSVKTELDENQKSASAKKSTSSKKKTETKKTTTKKTTTKKATTKKATTKKATTKKAAASKTSTKKVAAKKTTSKKASSKKATGKKKSK